MPESISTTLLRLVERAVDDLGARLAQCEAETAAALGIRAGDLDAWRRRIREAARRRMPAKATVSSPWAPEAAPSNESRRASVPAAAW